MEDEILDASGLACPLPILRLKKKMKTLSEGEIVKLLITDASSAQDIAAFCSLTHNTLVDSAVEEGVWVFYIKKGVVK